MTETEETRRLTPEEISALRRDSYRKKLKSPALRELYIAAAAREGSIITGDEAKKVSVVSYLNSLKHSRDEEFGEYIGKQLYELAQRSGEGADLVDYQSFSPLLALEGIIPSYEGSINSVLVSDVLELLERENVHDTRINAEQKEMFMEDYAQVNPQMYGLLVNTYFSTLKRQGIAGALLQINQQSISGLEQLLSSDANEVAEARAAAQEAARAEANAA